MARSILPGSRMHEISGSSVRYPRFQVLIWDPNVTTINEVADGSVEVPPLDLTAFIDRITYTENIGFESGDDPTVTRATFSLKRNPQTGRNLRRGYMDDGVIVRILQGDLRIQRSDWVTIFTGHFRGVPGDDPGTRDDLTEGFTAQAFGREEQFMNLRVTTEKFPSEAALELDPNYKPDLGEIAVTICQQHMGLGQNEILFGNQGFVSEHITNQLVEISALQAIYECLFPVGKKPKFDGQGRITAVDTDLDKSPVRIYSDGNLQIRRLVGTPNEIAVKNKVILKGLDKTKKKVGPDTSKMIVEVEFSIGYFDFGYKEDIWYSDDHSLTVDSTRIVNKTTNRFPNGTFWGTPKWDPETSGKAEDKRGELTVDTPYLAILRFIITILWAFFHGSRLILEAIGQTGTAEWWVVAILADLYLILTIGTMQFLGRFRVQVWGRPYEHVFHQLMSEARLFGLPPEAYRKQEFRNDFLSDMTTLNARARELLRRELAKCQTFQMQILDDPIIEVDDIIEVAPEDGLTQGDRYYVTSVTKTIEHGSAGIMTLTCWKISSGRIRETIEPLELGVTV